MAERADKSDYKIIHTFRIMHDGWEMDNEAWIARDKAGKLVWLWTSHGGLYDYGQNISELHDKLEETRNSIRGIKHAIRLMSEGQ